MFFYPDPEPIGHCTTEASPSYLTDGVFFNGRSVGPTHKCVAKQLSVIPRGPNDPVVPRAQVSPRTLEKWSVDSKAMYVDNCGRNARALHSMMKLLPKEKVDPYAGWRSKVAIFPRSKQYEYSYIRKMRIDASKDLREEEDPPKCVEVETNQSAPTPAFEYTKPPIWWKDKIPIRLQCAVGHPNDYQFDHRPDEPAAESTRNRKKSRSDHPGVYVPGVIIDRQAHPEKIGIEESLDGAEAVRVETEGEGEGDGPKDAENCDCSRYTHKKLTCGTEGCQLNKTKSEVEELDPRWHQVGTEYVLRNAEERKRLMSNLNRPYHHEINTWYSKNKPTKIIPALISEGKRPILEWHFSNL